MRYDSATVREVRRRGLRIGPSPQASASTYASASASASATLSSFTLASAFALAAARLHPRKALTLTRCDA